jgi:6-phosphofructokinase 1
MYVVREGYEGLVQGNVGAAEAEGERVNETAEASVEAQARDDTLLQQVGSRPDQNLLHNLRFGDGELLKDGTTEFVGGRTLKGRYIVRVGWDDVRGWFSQVCSSFSLPSRDA